jgi:hypothetical protein
LALAAHAQSNEPHVALAWRAPDPCPTEASVRLEVARLLAGSSASGMADAEVMRAGTRWRVALSMNGGERHLEAASCKALADATALIVAMAVDPERVAANRAAPDASPTREDGGDPRADDARAEASSPDAAPPEVLPPDGGTSDGGAPAGERAPEDAAVPERPTIAEMPPPGDAGESTSELHPFAAGLGVALDFGTLPAPGGGADIWVAWMPWRLRLEAYASEFAANSSHADATGAFGTFSLFLAGGRACYVARASSFELAPCAGGEGASLVGSGHGVSPANVGSSSWFAFDAALLGAWRFSPNLAILLRGGAAIPLMRPEFQINQAFLHQPSVASARGTFGLEVRF